MLVNGSRATYTKTQIMDATTTSLIHRGNGTGPDADSGWEKMCTFTLSSFWTWRCRYSSLF